jgi:hypothetical protein
LTKSLTLVENLLHKLKILNNTLINAIKINKKKKWLIKRNISRTSCILILDSFKQVQMKLWSSLIYQNGKIIHKIDS